MTSSENGPAPEISVAFVLRGDEFSPSEVTSVLEIEPTRTRRKGDPIKGTRAKTGCDAWSLSTPRIRDTDLPKYLRQLLGAILPKSEQLAAICQAYSLAATFECVAYVHNQTPALDFDNDVLSQIVRLGASLDVDLILIEPDPAPTP